MAFLLGFIGSVQICFTHWNKKSLGFLFHCACLFNLLHGTAMMIIKSGLPGSKLLNFRITRALFMSMFCTCVESRKWLTSLLCLNGMTPQDCPVASTLLLFHHTISQPWFGFQKNSPRGIFHKKLENKQARPDIWEWEVPTFPLLLSSSLCQSIWINWTPTMWQVVCWGWGTQSPTRETLVLPCLLYGQSHKSWIHYS